MKILVLCVCLILASTPSWSFFVKENFVEIDADEEDDWALWDRSLADDDDSFLGDCDARKKEKSSCGCKDNYCACCMTKAIFSNKESEACIGIVFIAETDKYDIVISENKQILYSDKVSVEKQGWKDVSVEVNNKIGADLEAELVLNIKCQDEPKKGQLIGCVMLNGDVVDKKSHKKEDVNEDFGCFNLEF